MNYPTKTFEFLGYEFRNRKSMTKDRRIFMSFNPAVSKSVQKSMRAKIGEMKFYKRTELDLKSIANLANPILRGWQQYYGRYNSWELHPIFRHFNKTLLGFMMRKYKKLKGHKTKAGELLNKIAMKEPHLFEHWKNGIIGSFV